MKKAALVISPPFWIRTPPLGIEYIKNYASPENWEIDIYDLNMYFYKLMNIPSQQWLRLNKQFEEDLFKAVKIKHPAGLNSIVKKLSGYSVVGFSIFKRNLSFSLNLTQEIRKLNPKVNIVWGGPEIREIAPPLSDSYTLVEGEGEKPFLEILKGSCEKSFSYREIEDLDILPFLTLKNFNLNSYSPVLPLLSSRGCIRKCKFCSEHTLYKKFRSHSPEYILEQIRLFLSLYSIKRFSFQDSLINSSLPRLEELCKNMLRARLNIKWEAQMIIRNDMDIPLMKLMKQAGCINLFIGFESASDRVLKLMDKPFSQKDALEFFKKMNKSGLMFGISLIAGYPGETSEDFQETISFLKRNKGIISKIAQISGFTLMKNSILYKEKPELLDKEKIDKRVNKLFKAVVKEKIRHKKSFIDNLRYKSIDSRR